MALIHSFFVKQCASLKLGSDTLIGQIRKRARRFGVRVNLTLQVCHRTAMPRCSVACWPCDVRVDSTLPDTSASRCIRSPSRCPSCYACVQLAPEESTGDGKTGSVLHATPLRASRALALRHVMRAFHFSMSNAVFLCTPASVAHKVRDRIFCL